MLRFCFLFNYTLQLHVEEAQKLTYFVGTQAVYHSEMLVLTLWYPIWLVFRFVVMYTGVVCVCVCVCVKLVPNMRMLA